MAKSLAESQDFGDVLNIGSHDDSVALDSGLGFEDDDSQNDAGSVAGSAHLSSGPDEEVFDRQSPHSSPQTSNAPSDLSDNEDDSYTSEKRTPSPYTPLKTRSPFRNPSSVRAMQTDITPPRMSNQSSQQRRKLHPSSQQGSPRSLRSPRSAINTPSRLSPDKKMRKEYPLILLHVTLLPLPTFYSSDVLESTLPPTTLANWKLLQEKIAQNVLDRGVLIPHPREDYDLLEERLLESLELKSPRILKCGHFHLSPEEETDILDHDSDDESDTEDADICQDCGRRIRDGRHGDAGTGSRRWDIKIFAANGLMRAGAWSAAWKEMERVDIEIKPWIADDMKRELELRREEEERIRTDEERNLGDEGVGSLDDERLREIYGQNPQPYNQMPEGASETNKAITEEDSAPPDRFNELSFWDLLWRFLYISARDRRNIAIFFLSTLVVFLVLRPSSTALGPSNPALQATEPLAESYPAKMVESVQQVVAEATNSVNSAVTSQATSEPEAQEEDDGASTSWTDTAEHVIQEILGD